MNIAKSKRGDKEGYVSMQNVKKEEFLGLIKVLEHLPSTKRPKADVTAASSINRDPTNMPSFRKAYGTARTPAPTIVFNKFALDDKTVAVGSIRN